MAKFGIQAIKLNNTQYSGIVGYQIDQGLQIDSEGSDGALYETLHSIVQVRSTAELTTKALKTWLTPTTGPLADSTDLPFKALDGSNGLIMYGAKSSGSGPGYSASSVHKARTALRGCIYATGIKWSLGNYADLMLRAMFKSSNGTAAVWSAADVALPTQVVPVEKYTLTALTIGAQAMTNVNDLEIAIDGKFDFDFSTGLPYPVDISGAGVRGPMSAVMTVDAGDLDVGEGTGACSAVFTNAAPGATIGANTVTITLNSAWSVEENLTGPNGQPIGRRLVVRTRYDGVSKPLAWAVG